MQMSRELIVRLVGGLGSQMHKYAVARTLALDIGANIKVDIRQLETSEDARLQLGSYRFDLDHFNIEATTASIGQLRSTVGRVYVQLEPLVDKYLRIAPALSRRIRMKLKKYIKCTLLDPDFRSGTRLDSPSPSQLSLPAYLIGEWGINLRLIEKHSHTLRREFTLRTPLSEEAIKLECLLQEHPSVGLHVRRGDYLIGDSFVAQESNYYLDGIARVTQDFCDDPNIFVFSDDPEWCLEELLPKIQGEKTIVRDLLPHEDFHLMTKCGALVTSNSSFSVMAAWVSGLSPNRICVPPRWFHDPALNARQLEQIPKVWYVDAQA